jgi:hypothetical protein
MVDGWSSMLIFITGSIFNRIWWDQIENAGLSIGMCGRGRIAVGRGRNPDVSLTADRRTELTSFTSVSKEPQWRNGDTYSESVESGWLKLTQLVTLSLHRTNLPVLTSWKSRIENANWALSIERRCDDVGCARGIAAVFKDTFTECTIHLSLASLVDNDENHGAEIIESSPVEISCTMAFRRLKEQLAHAQPQSNYYSRRLFLGGCRCSKFGVLCDYPTVKYLTMKTDYLRCTT